MSNQELVLKKDGIEVARESSMYMLLKNATDFLPGKLPFHVRTKFASGASRKYSCKQTGVLWTLEYS